MADNYLEKQQESYEQKRSQWLKNKQAQFLRHRKTTKPSTSNGENKA